LDGVVLVEVSTRLVSRVRCCVRCPLCVCVVLYTDDDAERTRLSSSSSLWSSTSTTTRPTEFVFHKLKLVGRRRVRRVRDCFRCPLCLFVVLYTDVDAERTSLRSSSSSSLWSPTSTTTKPTEFVYHKLKLVGLFSRS
jgi:hypothetical protein